MSFVMRFSMGTESDVFRDAMSIRETVFVHEQGVPGNLERDGRDGEALHVVAYTQVVEGDGQETRARLVAAGGARARLVTHCGFRAYPTPVVKVERVCVLRHYRGKQCGEALMRFIEKTAKEVFSQAPLMLHAMLHAKGFYTRLGYTETSEVFTEADRPHIIMSKL